MTIVIDLKKDLKKQKEKLKKMQKKKFDANDYLGKIPNWGAKNGVEYQRNLRNEW